MTIRRRPEIKDTDVYKFVAPRKRPRGRDSSFAAISLFSGAGLSDLGFTRAGFEFIVHVEKEKLRAQIGEANFPKSKWIVGDVSQVAQEVVSSFRRKRKVLDLLVATPPCQGMSSSNPTRGKRHSSQAKKNIERNSLLLDIVPIVRELEPRIIVAENVRQILTLRRSKTSSTIVEELSDALPEYSFFSTCIDVADFGIPQTRKRALIVGLHKRYFKKALEKGAPPWPTETHGDGRLAAHLTLREWLPAFGYERLNSSCIEKAVGQHPLHRVPVYDPDRYLQISSIPARSGKSAYENSTCPGCGFSPVPEKRAFCISCGSLMRNRPYVKTKGRPRLIRGFKSSYRRMAANRPAATITTASSHVGSDLTVHPWEHRVMSTLECAHLQTVPSYFDWQAALDGGQHYLIRRVIGEAFPPYFTFLHGQHLIEMLKQASEPHRLRMRAVRSRNNKSTELKMVGLLREAGLSGWRRNSDLVGKPDFVFAERRVALFVDGCFWHGCGCRVVPKRRQRYWQKRFEKNRVRDSFVTDSLRSQGWQVIRIWEHELTDRSKVVSFLKIRLRLSALQHTVRRAA
jgi:DNA (cytosine-5)-methyltransferase 1